MLTFRGDPHPYCDRVSRRDFLKVGALGIGGLGLADVLRLRAEAATGTKPRSVIMVCLAGGPSHIDMYDLKPDAPDGFRGEFKPINTNVPGFDICEHLPMQARIADKLALVRTVQFVEPMQHELEEVYTGFPKAAQRPSFGSIVSRFHGGDRQLPAYVSLDYNTGTAAYESPQYVGAAHRPLQVAGTSGVRNLSPAYGINQVRIENRRELLNAFDTYRRDLDVRNEGRDMDAYTARAFDIVTSSKAREAFDLTREPDRVRERYGTKKDLYTYVGKKYDTAWYGYGMCCCASCNIAALARYAGMQARGWGINGHSVPEVSWDGKTWHMLDASLMTYFPKADGQLAGVEELVAGVQGWYDKNPGLRKDNDKLYKFMLNNGWKKGPDILSRCTAYDGNGWFPAATHGWYSTMQEYDCKPFVYEYGYSQGYQVNVQLRKGERLTRNWSNRGLHINKDGSGGEPGCLAMRVGTDQLRYTPRDGDLAPGRVGNGTHVYDVPLADGGFRGGALTVENLACKGEDGAKPAVHVKDAAKPGVLVLRMPSSYVYLGGEWTFNAVIGSGGRMVVSFSDNNGLAWKEVALLEKSGEKQIDVKSLVYRRYDYRLKFEMTGAGTGLDSLQLSHDVQHSQRALPALGEGKNTITFAAGPAEGTVTVEGSTNLAAKGKQLLYTDFHPQSDGVKDGPLCMTAGQGHVTFPIATPGDLVRLRFGCHYRARDAKDGWDLQVSFDGGKTFRTVDRAAGPTPGSCKYVTFADVPAGTRQALVRFAGSQRNTTCLFDYRIDADYAEPHGGFQPVRVTYRWDEDGRPKEDVRVVKQPRESYAITCAGKPVMKAIVLERE